MDFTRLYELIERFHRSNQLPAFVFGFLAALAITFLFLWKFRLRNSSSGAGDREIRALEKQVAELTAENKQNRSDLDHFQKHADALKARLFELTGGVQAQKSVTAVLAAECERLKAKLLTKRHDYQLLFGRHQLAKRVIAELKNRLKAIALSDGRIWEAAPRNGAAPFRPLNQRRTPILSLVNLKGGVGKTTIAANLAVAMSNHGWRVLVVDLDHQSSLSQLLLSPDKMDELVVSRRLVHTALKDATEGFGSFRQAIERASAVPDSEIFVVAADEELGDVETALGHSWHAKMTDDDVRYRLRAILHRPEVVDRFDFILLDCPPRLTTGCVNALGASDYVLIPVLPNAVSAAAVPRLLRWLKHLRKAAFPELSVLGVVGNKAKYYGDAIVKNQRAELDSLAPLCQEQWGEPIRFFPALRMHDPIAYPLPALDPKLGAAYLDLANQINKELPHYARSRSPELSQSTRDPVGSVRG
jgi:cellulose biosynthesis protein BcsQ